MKIAVYGAGGYTGRLAVAELARRAIDVRLVGRGRERLLAAAEAGGVAEPEIVVAGIDDPVALTVALRDCDAVINCAGPFAELGVPVVEAAIAAGTHYVDTTGEQSFVKHVFETYPDPAARAGVTIVPGVAVDGLPTDLLANVVAGQVGPVETMTVVHGLHGYRLTRGSLRSALGFGGGELRYTGGTWSPATGTYRRPPMTLPGDDRPSAMMRAPLIELVTIPQHVEVDTVDGRINTASMVPRPALAPLVPRLMPVFMRLLRTPVRGLLERLVDRLPEGPTAEERRAASYTFVVEARGVDGRIARGVATGADAYGISAVIAVEGARRLAAGGVAPGVLAAGAAFAPADFLDSLAPHGVSWSLDAPAPAAPAADR